MWNYSFCGAYLQFEPRCPHSAQSHSRCHRRSADPARREAPQQPSRNSRTPGCFRTYRDTRNALNTGASRCSHSAPTLSCSFVSRLHAGLAPGATPCRSHRPSRPPLPQQPRPPHARGRSSRTGGAAPLRHFRPAPRGTAAPPRPGPCSAPIGRQPRGSPALARYWPTPPSTPLKSPPSGAKRPGRRRRGAFWVMQFIEVAPPRGLGSPGLQLPECRGAIGRRSDGTSRARGAVAECPAHPRELRLSGSSRNLAAGCEEGGKMAQGSAAVL